MITEVLLKSGSTLVMGGLTREEVTETSDKVPLLGSVPLLGNLFKSKGQLFKKKNLLIFVTATLVDENGMSNTADRSQSK
jgi:general secretion pathway protein D